MTVCVCSCVCVWVCCVRSRQSCLVITASRNRLTLKCVFNVNIHMHPRTRLIRRASHRRERGREGGRKFVPAIEVVSRYKAVRLSFCNAESCSKFQKLRVRVLDQSAQTTGQTHWHARPRLTSSTVIQVARSRQHLLLTQVLKMLRLVRVFLVAKPFPRLSCRQTLPASFVSPNSSGR
jgi:hypothetical protein